MTKRDIIKFLERKHQEKLNDVAKEYNVNREQYLQDIYSQLGLPKLADKIQPLLEQAHSLWCNWKNEREGWEGLAFNNSFYSLPDILNSCTSSDDATFKRIVNDYIRLTTEEQKALQDEFYAHTKSVNTTFNTVIATTQQMKTAKQAAAYLNGLGFDMSELESPKQEVETALMIPVDTQFLFVKAA